MNLLCFWTFRATAFALIVAASATQAGELSSHSNSKRNPACDRCRLVFEDDFNRLDLGNSQASHTWYRGTWFERKPAPSSSFSVKDSQLFITWRAGQGTSESNISTFSKQRGEYHAWRYGYFEARMKWNPQTGAWPAFWMIPVEFANEIQPRETGEIDIFEGQGDEPRTFFGTIHRWLGSRELESTYSRNRFLLPRGVSFETYHTYGVLWEPGLVTWYFDGSPLHSERSYSIFDRQHYCIVLGMQEGVNWKSGDLTGVSAQELSLAVDWVRVWQR